MNRALAVVLLTLLCAALWAQGEPVQVPMAAQMDQGTRVPVQKVLRIRPFVPAEDAAVGTYLQQHKAGLSSQNYTALDNALRLLIGVDQTHIPLTRTPAQYMADYQTFTQLLGRTDWYVSLPSQPVPQITERTVTVERQVPVMVPITQVVTIPQPVIIPSRQFIQPAGVASIWTPAMPVSTGQVTVGDWQDRVWLTVAHQPSPVCRTSVPPGDGTCPPGVAPTPPAPPAAGGTVAPPPGDGGGNPGPSIPPGQPDHGVITPPNSGAPPPSSWWIADPVTENLY